MPLPCPALSAHSPYLLPCLFARGCRLILLAALARDATEEGMAKRVRHAARRWRARAERHGTSVVSADMYSRVMPRVPAQRTGCFSDYPQSCACWQRVRSAMMSRRDRRCFSPVSDVAMKHLAASAMRQAPSPSPPPLSLGCLPDAHKCGEAPCYGGHIAHAFQIAGSPCVSRYVRAYRNLTEWRRACSETCILNFLRHTPKSYVMFSILGQSSSHE